MFPCASSDNSFEPICVITVVAFVFATLIILETWHCSCCSHSRGVLLWSARNYFALKRDYWWVWVWVGEEAHAAENTEERILRLNEKIFGLWRWLEGTRQWISQGCRYIFEQAPDQPLLTCCPIVLVFVYQYKDATWPSEPNQSYCLKVTPCLISVHPHSQTNAGL